VQDLTGKLVSEAQNRELAQLVEQPLDRSEASDAPADPAEDVWALQTLPPDERDKEYSYAFQWEETLQKPASGRHRKLAPIKPKIGDQRFGSYSTPALHGEALREAKAAVDARRSCRLAVHRAVSPPAIYRQYKQVPAAQQDNHDFRPHDKALIEKRSLGRKTLYQKPPSKVPGGPVRVSRGEQKEDLSPLPAKTRPGQSRSATQLPALGGAYQKSLAMALGSGTSWRPKSRQPSGMDVLKKLRDGALPGMLVPPL